MTDRKLLEIAVVGGGVAGWTTAAAVARRLRGVRITVVPASDPAPSILDRIGIVAPSAREFHHDMRLGEAEFVRRTGAGYRLGSLFEGWTSLDTPFFHGYGDYGASRGGVPFHQIWLRAATTTPFDRFSVAAVAGLTGRFAHPTRAAPPLARYSYGFHVDPVLYASLMRDLATTAGVTIVPPFTQIDRDGERIALRLESGQLLRPHLVIDATTDGRIIAKLDDARVDWREHLPCDRAFSAERPDPGTPIPHDRLTAWSAGWHLSVPRPGSRMHMMAWSSAHVGEGRAVRAFRNATGRDPASAAMVLSPGRRRRAWIGNVVAVGEAAVAVGPVEGMALHLLHAHCDRLLALLPDRTFAQVELAEYNRQWAQEADRIRDFLHLPNHLNNRSDPFWREAARVAPSDALAYDLRLFGERGRLPVHDEDTFDRESWQAMMIGFGVRPRRTDALAGAIDPTQAAGLLDRLRHDAAAAAAALPPYGEYLAGLHQQKLGR